VSYRTLRIYSEARGASLPIEYVQLFGERNSGTSFLGKLAQANQRNPANFLGNKPTETAPLGAELFGYKHWFINWEKLRDERRRQTLFLVIYRNPYTWIRAMMARPYALERSIGGRPVADLPGIALVGHINGRDTRNELHPETGETINIFQLRKHKIGHFEKLKDQVENIAYLNLESLVRDPAGTMRSLQASFPSAFRVTLDLDVAAPRALHRECITPEPFADDDMNILDTAFDWEAEERIGYTRGSYALADAPA
jgi:hypothetical protein